MNREVAMLVIKDRYDTDRIFEILEEYGYTLTASADDNDLVCIAVDCNREFDEIEEDDFEDDEEKDDDASYYFEESDDEDSSDEDESDPVTNVGYYDVTGED